MQGKEARLRELAGLLSTCIDQIRDQKPAANDSLKKAFRAMADSIPTIIWTATRDGRVTFFNRRYYETFGVDHCDWASLLHPDDLEATVEAWGESVRSGQPFAKAARFIDVDGSWHSLMTHAHAVLDDDGDVSYWIGSSTEYQMQPMAVRQVA